jgi:hypothetical protein
VCSLDDPPAVRLQQCLFWLSFLQARVRSTEPLGELHVLVNYRSPSDEKNENRLC